MRTMLRAATRPGAGKSRRLHRKCRKPQASSQQPIPKVVFPERSPTGLENESADENDFEASDKSVNTPMAAHPMPAARTAAQEPPSGVLPARFSKVIGAEQPGL